MVQNNIMYVIKYVLIDIIVNLIYLNNAKNDVFSKVILFFSKMKMNFFYIALSLSLQKIYCRKFFNNILHNFAEK